MASKKKSKIVDPKNKLYLFIMDVLAPFIGAQINCHQQCRVLSYDSRAHTCEAEPLPLQSDGDKRAALTEVIVPESVYKVSGVKLKRDSIIWVGFGDRDMDNWSGGASNYKIDTRRTHSIQDAVVEAVIKP